MDKQLTRSDYIFALIFIVMLLVSIFAFFYGEKMGTSITTAKYEMMIKEKSQSTKKLTAYHQQYLVSFYHTIYLPYQEFEKKWFEVVGRIKSQEKSVDASSLLKELQKLDVSSLDDISKAVMPVSSPLLQHAQQNYIKSLTKFNVELKQIASASASQKQSSLLSLLNENAKLTDAKNAALQAQYQYYDSIVEWNLTMNPLIRGTDLIKDPHLSLDKWKTLNVNLKNKFIANYLWQHSLFKPYYVQDVTIRIDEMLGSGQAAKLKLTTISEIADLLVQLDAVRKDDFMKNKHRWYANDLLPQLPFFFK